MADAIYMGGSILTMNDKAMHSEAVAERDGGIVGVGSKDEIMKLSGPNTKMHDLGGRALLPDFVILSQDPTAVKSEALDQNQSDGDDQGRRVNLQARRD